MDVGSPVEDPFPTETGDFIGFWVGDVLVLHTNQSIAHIYERAQGLYSDQVEGIEIWRKMDANTIVANVWIYDPPALAEPWYTRQSFTMISTADKRLRINNWYCKGNPNNEVYETKEGGSQHGDFTFMKDNPKTGAAGAKKRRATPVKRKPTLVKRCRNEDRKLHGPGGGGGADDHVRLRAPLGQHVRARKTVTLTGVVKEFQYTIPHSWLIV